VMFMGEAPVKSSVIIYLIGKEV